MAADGGRPMPALNVPDPIAGSRAEAADRGSGQLSTFQDFGPQIQTAGIVHIQELDGNASDRANAIDACAFEGKVVGPSIAPRMKDGRQLLRLRIDSCQVRAFV